MSVNVTDNTVKIVTSNRQGASLAIRMMLQDVSRLADPITPRSIGGGELRRDKLISVNGTSGSIEWRSSYAWLQENNPSGRFKNYTTAGTGDHFAEQAVTNVVSKSDKYFGKAL